MRHKFLLLLTVASGLAFQSCKKNDDKLNSSELKKLTDVKVPEGFLWESSRDVEFKVAVSDTRFSGALHVIAIYDMNGKLLSKGSATINSPFETKIYLPSAIKEVIVIKTAPDNSTVHKKVEVDATELNFSLGAASDGTVLSAAKNSASSLASSPDCTTGCTQSVAATNGQWINVENNQTVCISGSNKSINLTFQNGGGIVRLCGTNLSVQNINRNGGPEIKLIITAGSSVSFPGLELDKASHVVENYGTATFAGLKTAGTVKNYGTLTVTGDYTLNSSSTTHVNTQNLTVGGTMIVGSTSTFDNSGTATVKKLQINGNAIFNNLCKLFVTEDITVDKILNNYSYVKISGKTQINGNATIKLSNGAYLETKDVDKIGGIFSGVGNKSLVKISGTINNNLLLDARQTNNSQKFSGPLEVCYSTALPAGLFKEGASEGCGLYIAQTGCNPGNGTAPVDPGTPTAPASDRDGDGISDNLDDYPDDASKAFNNYYPSNDADAGATIAFEDMWPAKGDYDMNDVVLSYKLKIVTNAGNNVVQVDGTYNLNARGGIYQNGFGIEFPVSRSLVNGITGAVLEEGQQKAVITLFENSHAEMLTFNTKLSEPVLPSPTYNFSFTLNNGPLLTDFGLGEYNPFIWNRASGRGYEIHLPGKTPTSLANLSLFGTGDDHSNPAQGKYYVTAEGFPWAISIPVKNFVYPIEGKDIITAYLKLPGWISSGGANYKDWYSNTASGYRNTANLFSK